MGIASGMGMPQSSTHHLIVLYSLSATHGALPPLRHARGTEPGTTGGESLGGKEGGREGGREGGGESTVQHRRLWGDKNQAGTALYSTTSRLCIADLRFWMFLPNAAAHSRRCCFRAHRATPPPPAPTKAVHGTEDTLGQRAIQVRVAGNAWGLEVHKQHDVQWRRLALVPWQHCAPSGVEAIVYWGGGVNPFGHTGNPVSTPGTTTNTVQVRSDMCDRQTNSVVRR